MKVVYLHQYFKTPDMSGGTRSFEMARRLVAAGHEVHVVTSTSDRSHGSRWRNQSISGINVHWLPLAYDNHMPYLRRILIFLMFGLRSMLKARRLKGDVVLATSTPLTIAIPGIAASLGKCPMVFEVRDLWPRVPIALGALRNRPAILLATRLERIAYSRSTAVVALSDDMAEGVRSAGFNGPVSVIPNSCDNELFRVPDETGREFRRSRPWLGERPLVVYTGTFGKVNGLSYMVELAERMLDVSPNVRFLAIGDGVERVKILAAAEQCGVLNNNFFMEPPVAKSALPKVLSAADVCTSWVLPLPELEANSANKFFDALAARRPIVINHGGWMKELIEREGVGVALDPLDTSAAARELHRFLEDPHRISQSRSRAAELAENRFSRDVLAAHLCDVLVESVAAFGEIATVGPR